MHLLAISRGARREAEPALNLGTYLMECNNLGMISRTGCQARPPHPRLVSPPSHT